MEEIDIDRRRLLKMGLTAGMMTFLPAGCMQLSGDKLSELLEFVSDSELPVNNNQTGELTGKEFLTLASMCEYVNTGWELSSDLSNYLKILKSDLSRKTSIEPSYLTEYKSAIALINLVRDNNESEEGAWAALLFGKFGDEDSYSTKIGRARTFVFSEIITHMVPISGGFKTFGLSNYRGYFGGAYTSPDSYRKAEVG